MEYTNSEMAAAAPPGGLGLLLVLLVIVALVIPLLIQLSARFLAGFKPVYGNAFKAFIAGMGVTIAASIVIGGLMGLLSRLMGVEITEASVQTPQIQVMSFAISAVSMIWSYRKFLRNPATGVGIDTLTAVKIYAGVAIVIIGIGELSQLGGGIAPPPAP